MKVTKQKIDRLADRAGVNEETAKEALERTDGDLLEAVILLEHEGKLGSARPENGTSWSTSSGVPAVIDVDTDFVIVDDADTSHPGAEKVTGGPVNGGAGPAGPKPEDFVGGPPPGGSYDNSYSYRYEYRSDGGAGNAGGPQGRPGCKGQQQQYYYDKKTGEHRQQYYYDKKTGEHHYRDESTAFEDGAKEFGRALLRILRGGVTNQFEVWYKDGLLFHFPVILFLLVFVPWIFWVTLVTLVIGLMAGWRYRFSGPHLGRKDGEG
jgi:hypothetical protein